MLWTAVIVLVSALIGLVSTQYLGDDNPLEELAEQIIELETGVEVDLSPRSADKKDPMEHPFEIAEKTSY